ncbi:MAG TPA: hypothetical protein VKH42_05080 [Vicinamibacterales bacterium]|nr:hypothetical protein [Vicinamibacterales bacterium]
MASDTTVVRVSSPSYQAYQILHVAFAVAPIVAGMDKFFHFLVNWDIYLSPLVEKTLGVPAHSFMMGVGIIEVIAGLLVAAAPRIGGYVVALWLCGIIVNLLSIPAYLDVALRDFGLALGAVALARLSEDYSVV